MVRSKRKRTYPGKNQPTGLIKPNRKHLESSNDVNEDSLFQCPEQGCCCEFANSEELQDHVHLGEHNMVAASGSLYDSLRHDWALKFSSLTLESKVTSITHEVTGEIKGDCCNMGWALQKPRGGGTRFTENVKVYLSKRFEIGETTGRKADPAQVAADMRKARDADGTRRFKRSESPKYKAISQGFLP